MQLYKHDLTSKEEEAKNYENTINELKTQMEISKKETGSKDNDYELKIKDFEEKIQDLEVNFGKKNNN